MQRLEGSAAIRRFAAQLVVAFLVLATLSVVAIYFRTRFLVEQASAELASSYVDLIVTMRDWNAMHGGVWVEKTDGVKSNPVLRELGVEPDTSTASGSTLTLRNPAAMTRELSELTQQGEGVFFKLTSLEPVNPENSPDAWEAERLADLRPDSSDAIGFEASTSGRRLRLMRPLVAQPECLRCHAVAGTRAGDVRGAISVSVPMVDRDRGLRDSAIALGLLWAVLVSAGGFTLYSFVYRLADRLDASQAELLHQAVTDSLTGLPNRRVTLERLSSELARARREQHAVGVILVDIDRFKSVNDSLGHAVGDDVLVGVSSTMRDAVREYDLIGRVGGEEFLVVVPATDHTDLTMLAERLREAVAEMVVPNLLGQDLEVTISAGCTLSHEADDQVDGLLLRADSALYVAKAEGRNRVHCV